MRAPPASRRSSGTGVECVRTSTHAHAKTSTRWADEHGGVDALTIEQVDWLYDKAYLHQYERTGVDEFLDAHEDELEQEIADLKGKQVEYVITRPVTDSGAVSHTLISFPMLVLTPHQK